MSGDYVILSGGRRDGWAYHLWEAQAQRERGISWPYLPTGRTVTVKTTRDKKPLEYQAEVWQYDPTLDK